MVGLVGVFVMNASPYNTIDEALASKAENIHVVGEVQKESLHQDLAKNEAFFVLVDGPKSMEVVYHGKPQPNLSTASKVVVIGHTEKGKFLANDMLLKCPSKYESTKDGRGTPGN